METGLSSNATPVVPGFRRLVTFPALSAFALFAGSAVAAQDDKVATEPPAEPAQEEAPRPRINVLVTVPRGEVNQAQAQECVDRADAGTISGEIVVCREIGVDNSALTGDRATSQKRYAQETAFKGAPPPPDMFGIPDNGKGIGIGGVPPPAVFIDVEALPQAPAGSDADRIARGLPPLNQNAELSEEEEKARREALGIKTTLPPRPATKKKKN
ncbi:Fructose 1,6-bisphosphatase II [Erythrobacter dokdonensis DSW-74]|jgi:hypothetical protein|uniref:Fructose 1,6-bisphosphatase II n=2 Tax=Erythrobacter TaxID=1041 RepID=A0A1A7BH73_9SPHN|nr:Fructose 1,6-bisphosphatase II [Erythrobacter dokdonensis DSW-74]